MKARPAVGRLRGKTRAGRLALWDALMVGLFPEPVSRGVAEVGAGERADTLLDLAALLGGTGASLAVLEVHPRRAAMAREALAGHRVAVWETDALEPVAVPGQGVVRCANVLRQYPVAMVSSGHEGLGSRVHIGGVVLEGSCDAGGDVGSFHVLRKTEAGLERESLVFFTSFARGFAPIQMRDWLPRDLRHQVRAGGALERFFGAWTAGWAAERTGLPPVDFRSACDALGAQWVDLSDVRSDAAAMVWRPADGVPAPT